MAHDPEHRDRISAALMAANLDAVAVCSGSGEVLGSDFWPVMANSVESRGLGKAFRHATGHGVGFAAANADALPRIHPLSRDVLKVGMTFNVEPAAYFDGYGGMRHFDVVAVTAAGLEVLTDF